MCVFGGGLCGQRLEEVFVRGCVWMRCTWTAFGGVFLLGCVFGGGLCGQRLDEGFVGGAFG